METLDDANVLYKLIEKFLSKSINLSPEPVKTPEGIVVQEGLSNLGMGCVFEELIRRFNEEGRHRPIRQSG